jgi:hypothetical protein
MLYKGQELTPITKLQQIFDPPKEMLVWDNGSNEPQIERVCAITMRRPYPIITCESCYDFCAEIPEEPKPKRATNLQLSEWLAKGNGMWKYKDELVAYISIFSHIDSLENEVDDDILIRPFGTTEWVEPTLENIGIDYHLYKNVLE